MKFGQRKSESVPAAIRVASSPGAGVAAGELVATWLIAEPAHSAAISANPIPQARLFILMSFIGRTLYMSRVIMPRLISPNFAIRAALSPDRLSVL